MDRLETNQTYLKLIQTYQFTFQYGQIRNEKQKPYKTKHLKIYIPVWIDQKPTISTKDCLVVEKFTFQYGQIRNQEGKAELIAKTLNLHSSMDRLETAKVIVYRKNCKRFTFQYGQIRNKIIKIKSKL